MLAHLASDRNQLSWKLPMSQRAELALVVFSRFERPVFTLMKGEMILFWGSSKG